MVKTVDCLPECFARMMEELFFGLSEQGNDLISSMLISGTQTHTVILLVPSIVVISVFNDLKNFFRRL